MTQNRNAAKNRTVGRILLVANALAFAVVCSGALTGPARADEVAAPTVPSSIEVPAGNSAFLVGHAIGTQNYVCLPSGSGFAFNLFTPEATLFNDLKEQVITHYFSPNLAPISPEIERTIRATWQAADTSTVWAKAIASYSNPGFVARGDVAELLLQVVGAQDGPTGGRTLSETTFIQRVNISGGAAPSTGCTESKDVGTKAFVPYTADYVFYKAD